MTKSTATSNAASAASATSNNSLTAKENTMKEATQSVEDVLAILESNGSTKGGQKFVAGRIYTRKTVTIESLAGIKLPAQARVCVRAILEGAGTWTEEELHDHVQTYKPQLKTVQDPWKIFTYYRPRLVKAGFITFNV